MKLSSKLNLYNIFVYIILVLKIKSIFCNLLLIITFYFPGVGMYSFKTKYSSVKSTDRSYKKYDIIKTTAFAGSNDVSRQECLLLMYNHTHKLS